MTGTANGAPELSLASTLLFPISGNPIGFNHLAAAEWLLRRHEALSRVCFVLSNGRHPDPTKPDAEVAADERLRLCGLALESAADPARSFLARQGELARDPLRLTPAAMQVSTLEFGFDRAVRTAELIPLLRAQDPAHTGRLHWCAGSDLIRRMADARIFAAEDLAVLAEQCHYHVLERDGEPVEAAVQAVREARGVALTCTAYPHDALPPWLGTFLALSSTRIRHAAEAGDPLAGMLPAPAAERIVVQGHYREGRPALRLLDPAGAPMGTRSELALTLDGLREALDAAAGTLATALLARRERKEPHGLALVETTTGGLITTALAGRSGASRYFRQSRFAYDGHAKATLLAEGGLDPELPGSAVSEESALALARAMRSAAGADYALAESGMAGPPDAGRRSLKYGLCCLAAVGPDGAAGRAMTRTVQLNPFLTRREHQLIFAREGLALMAQVVEGGAGDAGAP